jgi:CBS domain-containing protein
MEFRRPTVLQRNYVVVSPGDSLGDVLAAMSSTGSAFALVASHDGNLSATEVRGMITRKDIMDTVAGDMELFGG